MNAFLYLTFTTFFVTFTLTEAEVTTFYTERDASVDDVILDGHLLFQTEVFTKTECGLTCLKHKCCIAFSTSPKDPASQKRTCRGHDSLSVSLSSTIAAVGSTTFFVTHRSASGSSWLKRQCSSHADCPADVANAVCFAGSSQCLCYPGYYYTHCRDACVASCATEDLQAVFMEYPTYDVTGSDSRVIRSCQPSVKIPQSCVDDIECRGFDLHRGDCYVQHPSVIVGGVQFKYFAARAYYQRTCL